MKILITGGTGYIGSNLIRQLYKKGHEIYVIARKTSRIDKISENIKKVIYVNEFKELYDDLLNINADTLVNIAGVYYGNHDAERLYELLECNVVFCSMVLDAAIDSGVKNIVHTSSFQQRFDDEVYHPINIYAATKQAFEDILAFYTKNEKAKAITLQLFDTYGADDNRNKVFQLVRELKSGERFDMSSGLQKMYFCYIDDVVNAFNVAIELISNKEPGFNKKYAVRSNQPIALRDFIERYIARSEKKTFINFGERDSLRKEIMDPTGYGEVLPGWCPEISYDEGIDMCVEYEKLRG